MRTGSKGHQPLARLWGILSRRERIVLLLVSIGNTAAAVSVVLPSLVIGQIVAKLGEHPGAPIEKEVAALAGLLLAFVGLRLSTHVNLHRVLPRVEAELREAQIRQVLRTPMTTGNSESRHAAELNSLMGRGAKAGADAVKIVFADLMPATTQMIVAALAAVAANWLVGVVLLASGLTSAAVTHYQLRSQGGVRVAINRAKANLDGVMTELLRGKAVIRTLHAAEAESARVGRRAVDLSKVETRHHAVMGAFDALKNATEGVFAVIVLVVAAGFVSAGANPGVVLTLYLLFMQFAGPLRDIHRIRDELSEASTQLGEVLTILDAPLDPAFTRPPSPVPTDSPQVSFEDVCIQYSPERAAVMNITLDVPAGAYVGICGPAGSGKSTLVKALVGIIPVVSGEIRIAGSSISDLANEQLASLVGYVSQEPYLVAGTVRDNLLLGQTRHVSDARLRGALAQVQLLDEFEGLDRVVREDGEGLSGGQRQRLVLARVLLRPSKVIVLDEATSALDTLNERQCIRELMATGRTIIAIAHRLSTLQAANHIIVMKDGRISEQGTFHSLDAHGELFHDLLAASDGLTAA